MLRCFSLVSDMHPALTISLSDITGLRNILYHQTGLAGHRDLTATQSFIDGEFLRGRNVFFSHPPSDHHLFEVVTLATAF